ncbi:hypothetical protein [Jiulongibacter sp. NS-SX5]|uniref:hypothetical protein n=1 Tax=Jiulongibacter sp. NS-SX5 TaxID=3463854 RepID=UPI004057E850
MQTSHVISDLILGLVGLFVFFRYLLKLPLMETVLWEAFVLSVTVAAFAGAGRFAGIPNAGLVSVFFQNMAATVGALGLAVVSWFKVWENDTLDNKIGWSVLALGFLIFCLPQVGIMPALISYIPVVCMILIAAAAIVALINGQKKLGIWLLAAVLFSALATYKDSFVTDPDNGIDAYHYLIAISLICFGMAAGRPSR